MKLHINSKSQSNSISAQKYTPFNSSLQQTHHNLQQTKLRNSRPSSQLDKITQDEYLKIFSPNEKKHKISLFNFFIDKFPKRSRNSFQKYEKQPVKTKKQAQQGNFIIKKVKSTFPNVSTERLKVLPIQTDQDHLKKVKTDDKNNVKFSPQKQFNDRNLNKINENLNKNPKFDRKKYMYYRYRKKTSPEKNNISFKQIPEITDSRRAGLSRISFAESNIRTEIQTKSVQQNQTQNNQKEVQFRYTFLGVFPSKSSSFSQAKCKLTIEPMKKLTSHRLIDRKSLSKTSRELRQSKQSQEKSKSIFNQVINFKNRRRICNRNAEAKHNPEEPKSSIKKEEQILGWNLDQQLLLQDEDF